MSAHDEHQQMVKDCIDREAKLTDWERSFIDSIERQLATGRRLQPLLTNGRVAAFIPRCPCWGGAA